MKEILYCIFGTLLGSVLGLLPGLHINNILPLILSLSLFSSYELSILIVSIAVAQILISYIPSIFLGAPEEGTALAVLPGHRMLLEGRGYEAILLSIFGSICSLIISLILIAVCATSFRYFYKISRSYIHYAILFVIGVMVLSERKFRKILSAIFITFLSGIFGTIVLNTALISQQNVLFPVLAGLFGISTLIVSLSQKSKIPEQKKTEITLKKREMVKSILLGSIAGILVGFLPAIGVSQAAALVQLGKTETESFLLTLSSINIANEIFSLISLYLVGNPRSGASVAIQRILGKLSFWDTVLLIGTICFSSGIAAILALILSKKVPKILVKLNYKTLNSSVIIFVLGIIFLLTGFNGLLIVFVATSIGVLCNFLEIRKSHCMGVLLLPSIFFFAGLTPFVVSILGL
jgi:putative membrane protein